MIDFFQTIRREGDEAVLRLRELTDVNLLNDSGENLLHVAIAYSNTAAALELLRLGVDVNHQAVNGMTPLHYAAVQKNASVARGILDCGGNPAIVDIHGNSALWTAVFNARGEFSIVELLLNHGAGSVAHLKNKHGRSPRDFAAQIGDSTLIALLDARS